MKNFIRMGLILFNMLVFLSCNKGWLDVRKDQKLVIPTTIDDYQALLDNIYVFNRGVESVLGELSSDDLFCLDAEWQIATEIHRKAYIWSTDLVDYYSQTNSNDWSNYYQKVFYANVVIEGLNKSPQPDNSNWRSTIGQAYFWRAWAFYHLAQLYCEPYHPNSLLLAKGIPLPLISDINKKHGRATLNDTYQQIESDILQSISYLSPENENYNRPSLLAAYGLYCRFFLQKGDYISLKKIAQQALLIAKPLLDYNKQNVSLAYSFNEGNQEVILNTSMSYSSTGILIDGRMKVDTFLFNSYHKLDKRRALFFKQVGNYYTYKGTYSGGIRLFAGLSVDEIYLNYLEAEARLQQLDNSNSKLVEWIRHRYDLSFNLPNLSHDEILRFVLDERRKQLIFRGIRWQDMRRLKTIHNENIDPTRVVNKTVYKLNANNKLYVFEIPTNVFVFNDLL